MKKRSFATILLILLLMVAILVILGLWGTNKEDHPASEDGTSSSGHFEARTDLNGKSGARAQSPRNQNNSSNGIAQGAKPASVLEFKTSAKVELQPGETLVMGGFLLPDGQQEFTFVSPIQVDSTGRPDPSGSHFTIKTKTVRISQETAREIGMDAFTPQRNNSYRHTENWNAENLDSFMSAATQDKGVALMTAPYVTSRAGQNATLEIGNGELNPDNQYRVETSISSSADGKLALDYSLTRRIPRNRP